MNGTVYLGGGGSAEDESLLWDELFGTPGRVLYWPFALPASKHAGAAEWLRGSLAGRGSFDVQVWSSLGGRDPAALSSFDVIFIGGGDTYDLLDEITGHEFAAPLCRYVASGGVLYGGSAGACLAGTDISIDEESAASRPDMRDSAGLGLVPLVVRPHYTADLSGPLHGWAAEHGETVLGIPERGGAVFTGGGLRCTGPEPLRLFSGQADLAIPPGGNWSPGSLG
jgi:dipeptidase E